MKIGYSYWGVCANFEAQASINVDTADGSRFNRHVLVDALLSRGHTVVALQQRQEPPYEGVLYSSAYPELDLLFLEWRWPTYKNVDGRDSDLRRQRNLLEAYHGCIPIVALDNDFKLTSDDEKLWPNMKVVEPSLAPKKGRERLLPWTDWKELLPCREPLSVYGYIGNNYDRCDEFNKYYFEPAARLRRDGVQTSMLGNWLQKSPERGAPEWLVANTSAAFLPRCNFNAAMRVLNSFICTTHVCKTEYYANQLVPPRYFEALSVNCPALTAAAAPSLGTATVVTGVDDVRRAVMHLKTLSLDARRCLVAQQRDTLRATGLFDVANAVSFLESLCA